MIHVYIIIIMKVLLAPPLWESPAIRHQWWSHHVSGWSAREMTMLKRQGIGTHSTVYNREKQRERERERERHPHIIYIYIYIYGYTYHSTLYLYRYAHVYNLTSISIFVYIFISYHLAVYVWEVQTNLLVLSSVLRSTFT